MRYTLRQLEVFLATARAQSLSRAADGLAMSQSAASDALAAFEQQFDVRLFDRIGKRLQLHDTGRALLPAAEELLVRARELEDALGRHDAPGSLAVGATLSIGNYLAVTSRSLLGGCGSETAGLAVGGYTGAYSAVVEEYNGASWSAVGSYDETSRMAVAGSQANAMAAGGDTGSATFTCQTYDGTSWAVVARLPSARYSSAAAGTAANNTIVVGGFDIGFLQSTVHYSSAFTVSWVTGGSLPAARAEHAGTGTLSAGLAAGGRAEEGDGRAIGRVREDAHLGGQQREPRQLFEMAN